MDGIKKFIKTFKTEITIYRSVLTDKRTPFIGKLFLGLAVGYLLLPFDFIPDFVPVIGELDDILIVPLLVVIALKLIPKELIQEYRKKLTSSS